MFGRMVRVGACPDCGGKGKIITDKCPDCKGKGYVRKETKVSLSIPAGVDTNSYIRKRGFGQASTEGGPAGDLIVVFASSRTRSSAARTWIFTSIFPSRSRRLASAAR